MINDRGRQIGGKHPNELGGFTVLQDDTVVDKKVKSKK